MAQKRINKNLVAFLTVMFMAITIAVFGAATYYSTQKDPEKYARKAHELEQAGGDLGRAIDLYRKSYDISKDVKYLIEVARCAYEMGDLRMMFNALQFAHGVQPDNTQVLQAALERMWELKDYGWRRDDDMLLYANKLLKLEKDNVFALVCQSLALQALAGDKPQNKEQAAQALQRAVELKPNDPRVVLTRANQEIGKIFDLARDLRQRTGGLPADFQDQARKIRQQAAAILKAGYAANPDDSKLIIRYAEVLGADDPDEARRVLEAGVAARPTDSELHLGLARFLLQQLLKDKDKPASAERQKLLDAIAAQAARAVELEPALYIGHALLAQTKLLNGDPATDAAADLDRRYEEALKIYENAIRSTVGRKSIKAVLNTLGRLQLIYDAFNTAWNYRTEAKSEEQRKNALAWVRKFLDSSRTEYPDIFVTHFIQGNVHLANNDTRAAIQSLLRAEEKTRDTNWFVARLIYRLSNERVALLYAQENQSAAAVQYAERAIQGYREDEIEPPLQTWLLLGQLYVALDQSQKALDLLVDVRKKFPESPEIVNIQAAALTRLGRAEEANRLLGQLAAAGPEKPGVLLMQAKVAAYEKKYTEAEAALRKVLDGAPENLEALRLYVQVAAAAERREPARQYLQALLGKMTRDEFKRLAQYYDVLLATPDPKEYAAKTLEILEKIPDAATRAAELYNFYVLQDDYDKAAVQLDALEKLRSGEPQVLEQQFLTAVRRKDWPRAEKYVIQLAEKNTDLVRGATYRGRLSLARGDAEKAVSEYRTAERELPADSRLKVQLAQALLNLNPPHYDEALEILKYAVEKINPRDFDANRLLYLIYEQMGRRKEGEPYLRQAARLQANDPYVQERIQQLDEEQDPPKGIARREALRQKEPQNLQNLVRLAQLYAKAGNKAKAQEMFQAAAAVNVTDLELAYLASEFYSSTNDREGGEKFLRAHLAAAQGRGQVRAQMLLGLFHERLGDYATARDYYLEADKMVETAITDAKERRLAHVEAGFQLIDFYARWRLVKELVEACRRVLDKLDPQEVNLIKRARLGIIDGLLKTRRHGDAEKEVEAYSKLFPKDIRGLIARAQLQLARSQLRDAMQTLTLVLEQDEGKDESWSLFTRGSIRLDLGLHKEALVDLTNAKRVAPLAFNMAHRLRLATVYEITGQPQLAVNELREILEAQPSNTMVAQRLLRLMHNLNQTDKAQEMIRQWMARQPQEAYWPYQLGLLMLEQRDLAAAVAHMKTAVDLSSGLNPKYLSDWLGALLVANRSPEAIRAFEALKPEQLSPLVRAAGAQAYLQVNQRPQALTQLELGLFEAARVDLNDAAVLAIRMAQLLKPDEVVGLLQRLLSNPQTDKLTGLRLRDVLGSCLMEIGQPNEALKILEPVVEQAPAGSAERLQALLLRARAYNLMKRTDEMLRTYEQMLTEDENNVQAMNNLAYVMADELNRPQEALKYAEKLRQLAEDKPDVLDTIGWVYFLNGKADEAQQILKQALAQDPNNLDILHHLGQSYAKIGRTPEAREIYRRLQDLAKKRQNLEFTRKAEEALEKLK